MEWEAKQTLNEPEVVGRQVAHHCREPSLILQLEELKTGDAHTSPCHANDGPWCSQTSRIFLHR